MIAIDQPQIFKITDEEIKGALRYGMLVVGVKPENYPSEEGKQVLVNFIRTNYGGHTAKEIQMAFDLAVSGNLNLDQKDVESYQSFSAIYIGKILNAFRIWSRQEYYQQHRQLESKKQAEIKELPSGKEDWPKQYFELVKSAKNGVIRKEFIPTYIYDWLKAENRIEMDPDELWETILMVTVQYYEEMQFALRSEEPGYIPGPEIKERISILKEILSWEESDQRIRCLKLVKTSNKSFFNILVTLAKQEIVRQIAMSDAAG